jgi:hypothetical protein
VPLLVQALPRKGMNTLFSRYRFLTVLIVLFLAVGGQQIHAQQGGIEELIAGKRFVFQAQTMLPQRGIARPLNGDYFDVRIKNDTLQSVLPYFGRAYAAPVNPGEGGLRFTSSDYSYQAVKKKKEWRVTIRPKDVRDIREMIFYVSENGYARLVVLSNFRESIQFNGEVIPVK